MTCIICNTTENLNIEISATDFNGAPTVVKLCEACGEDTTPKKAREAYAAKQKEIADFMEKAKALGLTFNTGPGIAVAAQAPVPAPAPTARVVPTETAAKDLVLEEGEISVSRYEAVSQSGKINPLISGDVGGGMSGYAPPVSALREMGIDQLEGKVKMDVMTGPSGMPLAIPTMRRDQMGTTTIGINQTSDADLQRRFQDLIRTGDPPKAYENIRTCSLCHGEGTIRQTKTTMIQCPKCVGTGMIA